ncbi:MAG: methylmalonyl Co-A mutase-associated GTPase MeaB [Desulfobacteraceae bacterium]|jgi:LAO/AO transport system kinase
MPSEAVDLKRVKAHVDGVLQGNRRMLAKTITLVESTHPDHRILARSILDHLLPHTGKVIRLGITGVPGVGKSTFIESMGIMLVEKGHKVAVLAVDPSSSRSGGSILADKTRMEKLCNAQNAFIRPSPSGGTLGGVALMTRESMLVCEAAGFDVVIVETVGVGQSETTVHSMVDFFLVLMLAGAGDELQGIKKGVLELADALVINKADGDNVIKAQKAQKQYENALHLLKPNSDSWSPPVSTCSALTKTGLSKIWEMVCRHRRIMTANGELNENRKRQNQNWMWSLLEEGLKERFLKNEHVMVRLPKLKQKVGAGTVTPAAAAGELLNIVNWQPHNPLNKTNR